MRRLLKRLLAPLEIILVVLYRLVPSGILRPPNFAPVGGIGIYGGARLPLWQALSTPLLIMLVSDFLLWKLARLAPFDVFVYVSFVIYVLLGRLVRHSRSPARIALVTFIGSLQFYLITNFGFWYKYDSRHTLAGLLSAYLMGLPYFPFTLGGDLAFTGLLVYVHDWVAKHLTEEEDIPEELPATAEVPADAREPAVQPEQAPA
ncbi:MAG TPA: DUF6580 family putative transport protein [Gemmataceae bacterium]|nr:DUF6580 family putative transport protein [Gemmataceae bacterium]